MGALLIAGGAQADSTNGAGLRGVIVFLMGLDIGAKRDSDVLMIVNLVAFEKVLAGIVRTYTVLHRKGVPPKQGH